jgi:DNA recombination protein RmuC
MEYLLLLVGLAVGALGAFFVFRQRDDSGERDRIYKEMLEKSAATEQDLRARLDLATRAASAAQAQAERIPGLEGDLARAQGDFSAMRAEAAKLAAELKAERDQGAEKQALWLAAEAKFVDTFKALSSDTLKATQTQFLEVATGDLDKRQVAIDGLVGPVREALEKMGLRLTEIEQARAQSYGALTKQVESLGERSERLSMATTNLASALKNPSVRGKWGENTLRRSFELAGLNNHIDFDEQAHVAHEGESFRPDAIVRLPGGRAIVVDAKAPAEAYFKAHDASESSDRLRFLKDHATQLRGHVRALASKNYGAKVEGSPEFVLLFLPNEGLLSAAVEADPDLLEFAAESHVALATPLVFQAMLWVIAYAWRQEGIAANAREIQKLGTDLYDRMAMVAKHVASIGSALDDATNAYNKSVSSLETRLLPSARKLRDFEAAGPNAPDILLPPVEVTSKTFTKSELL